MRTIRPYLMPFAMIIGVIFYNKLHQLAFITPFLIGFILFLTYLRIDFKKIRLKKEHFILLGLQISLSIIIFILVQFIDISLAQGMMICILTPTATSAPVIVRILKGNVETLLSYTILSNMVLFIIAPIMLTIVQKSQSINYYQSFIEISKQTSFLLIVPFLMAFLISKIAKKDFLKTNNINIISFLLWLIALAIVTSKTLYFIFLQKQENYLLEVLMFFGALFVCWLQFFLGRKIGKKYHSVIAFGQSFGQKNTILAIWFAQTYLNPISCLVPSAYIIWQNSFNSWQIWKQNR